MQINLKFEFPNQEPNAH